MIDEVKGRVVAATNSLFSHGPQPLADTLSHPGDPGLLGPDSVSWEVIGDAAAFVGGIRALLVQTAHPEVVAGVEQHSQYRTDPLGRLTRTSAYVTETTYGAMPEVEAAVATVRRAHAPVRGTSERQQQAIEFLQRPPLPLPVKAAYRVLAATAGATVPDSVASTIGLTPRRSAEPVGRRAVGALRWALGSSPSWHVALVRVGAPVPPGRFRQPLPSA